MDKGVNEIMEKIYTYMMITTVILILLNLFGIATATGAILGGMGLTNPDNLSSIQSSPIFAFIIVIALVALALLSVTSIINKTISDLPITATLATAVLVTFIMDLASVITYVDASWEKWLLFLVVAPLVTGYIIALYDWVRGKD